MTSQIDSTNSKHAQVQQARRLRYCPLYERLVSEGKFCYVENSTASPDTSTPQKARKFVPSQEPLTASHRIHEIPWRKILSNSPLYDRHFKAPRGSEYPSHKLTRKAPCARSQSNDNPSTVMALRDRVEDAPEQDSLATPKQQLQLNDVSSDLTDLQYSPTKALVASSPVYETNRGLEPFICKPYSQSNYIDFPNLSCNISCETSDTKHFQQEYDYPRKRSQINAGNSDTSMFLDITVISDAIPDAINPRDCEDIDGKFCIRGCSTGSYSLLSDDQTAERSHRSHRSESSNGQALCYFCSKQISCAVTYGPSAVCGRQGICEQCTITCASMNWRGAVDRWNT